MMSKKKRKKESFVKPKHSKDLPTLFGVRWLDTAFFLSFFLSFFLPLPKKLRIYQVAKRNPDARPGFGTFILTILALLLTSLVLGA